MSVHLLQDERVGVVQPGEGKALGRPYSGLKGTYKKGRGGLFTRACSDRTRSNGFKLNEGRFRLGVRRKFFTMRVVKQLEQIAQRSCGCPESVRVG